MLGYPVSIHKSDKVKVTFICIKGGPIRKRVDDTVRQRKRSSRKIGCMFKATARLSNKDEKWHLTITNATHNHDADHGDQQQQQPPEQNEVDSLGPPGPGPAGDTLMGGTGDLGLLDENALNSPSTLEVVMRYPLAANDLAGRVMNLETAKRAEENAIRELREQNRLFREQNELLKQQVKHLSDQTQYLARQTDLGGLVNLLAPVGTKVLIEYYLSAKFAYNPSAHERIAFISERLPRIAEDLNMGLEKVYQVLITNFPFGNESAHETTLHNIIVAVRLSDDSDVLEAIFRRCFGEGSSFFANRDRYVCSRPPTVLGDFPRGPFGKHFHGGQDTGGFGYGGVGVGAHHGAVGGGHGMAYGHPMRMGN